jgi:DME family drug/metabolite transporter
MQLSLKKSSKKNFDAAWRGSFFVLLGATLWGTNGTAQSLLGITVNPFVITCLRMGIGGGTLLLVALVFRRFSCGKPIHWRAIFFTSISVVVHVSLFFWAVTLLGVAMGTMLALGSGPIFSGILSLFRKEKMSWIWLISVLISLLGIVLLFGNSVGGVVSFEGVLVGLLSGFADAWYVIFVQQMLADEADRLVATGMMFGIGFLILLPALFLFDVSWVATGPGLSLILYLGILTAAVADTLFSIGVVDVPTHRVVILNLAEPLTASLLGIVLLRESLSVMQLIGIGLLFLGMVVNGLPEPRLKVVTEFEVDMSNIIE